MEKSLALALLLLSTLLITNHELQPVSGQAFCRSQISLANEACSLRNFPGPRPSVPRHGQQLNQQLNETSASTAPLRSRDGDDGEEEGEEDEGRQHRRRHRHSSSSSSAGGSERDPYDTACCRRLMALENACVCQAAARLPPFLSSVWHVIRLTPVDGCNVSFECPGSYSPLG
ncbi:uncharacterized protein LOC100828209 [Brachypodium distachyon]|uniref:Bifunctional inhibitor/plant lipid transfer protein/seed storage helical domain-containing protein n=1 Tax=Brachypodium distachyon TaxID=15368 RepID=I1I368_BRADI|nr:uncharacterized protein LOC100828209 [Brachypodium distachyon]KQJ96242.1 hypothetical protein BRADI_3g21760v3 [Brachypodium distachyon]|eukprot:XP_003573774.1 uncharacterized protein LOC100828209 [Brachypodium distachyon]